MANFERTEDYTFAKFCNVFESFNVPKFQRPYAWTNKNIQDFWYSIISNDEKYFIGNVVAVKGKPLSIVDGQQRLTTISLLLIALRDVYREIEITEKDRERVKRSVERIQKYLEDDDLEKSTESKYRRLVLGKESYQEVYDYLVEGKYAEASLLKLSDTQKRYLNNYKILKKLVKDYIKGSELERLDKVLKNTLELQFIVIVCETDNDIYRIFEGFNSTGLGLSVADLVKNALLRGGESNKEIQDSIEANWNELENLFDEKSVAKFPKFLRYQWISYNGYIQSSHLYKKINDEKIEKMKPEDINNYVKDVLVDGKVFLGMLYKEHEKFLNLDDDIIDLIKEFRFLRNEQVYEVLLSYYSVYKNKKIRKSFFTKVLRRLWIFVARARFVSVNPSDYEKIFAKHCTDIQSAKNSDAVSGFADSFLGELKKLVSSEEQFVENFVADIKYGSDNRLIARVIMDIMKEENPSIKMNKPEIEHILPQKPEKWGLEEKEIKDHVNKIGNLTLLFEGDNKSVGNEIMDIKTNMYKKSNFKFNKAINTKWCSIFKLDYRNAIYDRSVEIAKQIESIWKI